jgi:integrase/recombinase XerD|tara:strand:- start:9481 stop:10491 length:1011 start_codon:yes stop_codon:yes gene_type:complete
MKPTDFSQHVTNYLTHYLAAQRNMSPNTIKSYRDAFVLFLQYCRDEEGVSLERLQLKHINVTFIESFLEHLKSTRHCSPRTVNQRLAILHSFFRYVQAEEPEHLFLCQQVLAMPYRRYAKPPVGYLSKELLTELLTQPDLATRDGRRDATLLSVLYDTGARVQELLELSAEDVSLRTPAQIRLIGKGRKMRVVPLMDSTVAMLQDYMDEQQLRNAENSDLPLFRSRNGNRLTRSGIRYILDKYIHRLRQTHPEFKQKVSPHSFRHTKGMHLLQSGVTLDIIRDFLGHADVRTTEIYAKSNLEMKRDALNKASGGAVVPKLPSWKENKTLLNWLQSL